MRYSAPIIAGATALLMQTLLLRELLTASSGNELDMGITLATWLVAVGAGSLAGHRARHADAFAYTFLAIGLLAIPPFLLLQHFRSLFDLPAGEIVPLGITLIITTMALGPLCFVLGMQFPLAVRHMGSQPSRVYSLETLGAFISGVVFTFLLSASSPMTIALGIAAANIATASVIARRKRLVAFVILPVCLALWWQAGVMQSSYQITHSPYGEIRVSSTQGQRDVFTSGHFDFSYPDTPGDERSIHLAMALAESTERVLLVGGSLGGAAEALKYRASSIDFVMADPALLEVSKGLLQGSHREILTSPRVRLIAQDGRRFIAKGQGEPYDAIVLRLPPPATASTNRYYTVEFFRALSARLTPRGVLCLYLPTSSGYMSRAKLMTNASVAYSLRQVFPHVSLSSDEYGLVAVSNAPFETSPSLLIDRFTSRGIDTQYFSPSYFQDAFDPVRTEQLTYRITRVQSTGNTDRQPVSYLHGLMLWAQVEQNAAIKWTLRHTQQIISICAGALLVLGFISMRQRQRALQYSVFSTGFASMGFSVALMLAFQSEHGYIYERFGLFSAMFMAGGAIGSSVMGPRLVILEILASLLLAAYALLPVQREMIYYCLSLLGGTITGALFASASRDAAPADALGGRLYGADMLGAFAGALVVTIFLIPKYGTTTCILALAGLKTISAAITLRSSRA